MTEIFMLGVLAFGYCRADCITRQRWLRAGGFVFGNEDVVRLRSQMAASWCKRRLSWR